ncbi:hypothetical protein S40288_04653 [Stachybotrys chartarum IBT 40288]|nr:hypothetical protein S40288_04653 [Stachybotrys chartarum IBT 40288]
MSQKLTVSQLNRNRIFLDDDPPEDLQHHIDSILDFQGTIRVRIRDDNSIMYDYGSNYLTLHDRNASDTTNVYIRRISEIRSEAYSLNAKRTAEQPWNEFFHSTFFKPLHNAWLPSDTDSRAISRQKYFYDSFEYHGERNWTLFDGRGSFRRENRKNLTAPRPDRAFYFTTHDMKSRADTVHYSRRWKWKNTPLERFIENFSLDALEEQKDRGLYYCPFRSNPTVDSYRPDNLLCFPWLIVEHKKGNVSKAEIKFGECQAANASVAALMLLESAAKYSQDSETSGQLPPVFAITTVGKLVRIWIAWHDNASVEKYYGMASIWDGDVTDIEDIIKFEAILENIHTWATRFLKPALSNYIDEWRYT